ncbi:hypothetical protein WJX74_004293 [Apatococcus lobatus]|uniref:Uncharacterized protein n=1 Tax=Apatococcus lobatus TaxID=904363 RepID=A0AAW1RR05_9CHLO
MNRGFGLLQLQAIAEYREEDAEWQLAKRPMRSVDDADTKPQPTDAHVDNVSEAVPGDGPPAPLPALGSKPAKPSRPEGPRQSPNTSGPLLASQAANPSQTADSSPSPAQNAHSPGSIQQEAGSAGNGSQVVNAPENGLAFASSQPQADASAAYRSRPGRTQPVARQGPPRPAQAKSAPAPHRLPRPAPISHGQQAASQVQPRQPTSKPAASAAPTIAAADVAGAAKQVAGQPQPKNPPAPSMGKDPVSSGSLQPVAERPQTPPMRAKPDPKPRSPPNSKPTGLQQGQQAQQIPSSTPAASPSGPQSQPAPTLASNPLNPMSNSKGNPTTQGPKHTTATSSGITSAVGPQHDTASKQEKPTLPLAPAIRPSQRKPGAGRTPSPPSPTPGSVRESTTRAEAFLSCGGSAAAVRRHGLRYRYSRATQTTLPRWGLGTRPKPMVASPAGTGGQSSLCSHGAFTSLLQPLRAHADGGGGEATGGEVKIDYAAAWRQHLEDRGREANVNIDLPWAPERPADVSSNTVPDIGDDDEDDDDEQQPLELQRPKPPRRSMPLAAKNPGVPRKHAQSRSAASGSDFPGPAPSTPAAAWQFLESQQKFQGQVESATSRGLQVVSCRMSRPFKGFLPKALMEPALLAKFEQNASGGQSGFAESVTDKSARLQGLLIDNLCVALVDLSQTCVTISQQDASSNPDLARMSSQVTAIQSRLKRTEPIQTSWWPVKSLHGPQLGSPQSQAARTKAEGLVQHQTPVSGVVTGYDPEGLIIEGPGFTGWLMSSRMHSDLRRKQRAMMAMAVFILEDTYGDEHVASWELARNPGTRLRASRALGAAAMIGERIHGLYVMHVATCEARRSYQPTAVWLTQDHEDLAVRRQLLPPMPATQVSADWLQDIACGSSQHNQATVNPELPPLSKPRQVAMSKDGIMRIAAAFQVCEARQPFTGRIVGHSSSGLFIHGAGITGLLEVDNFSEEIAAAQLNAQRRCRLDLSPWALKFNHELMIDIALDTLIGRRLQGLILSEVAMPHGSLLLAAAPGQTITFALDMPSTQPDAEVPQVQQAEGRSQPSNDTASREALARQLARPSEAKVSTNSVEMGMTGLSKDAVDKLPTIDEKDSSLENELTADMRQEEPEQGTGKEGETGFAKGLWQSAVSFFIRPDIGIPSEGIQAEEGKVVPETGQQLGARQLAADLQQEAREMYIQKAVSPSLEAAMTPATAAPEAFSAPEAAAPAAASKADATNAPQNQAKPFPSRQPSPGKELMARQLPGMTVAVRLLLSQKPFEGRVVRCATSGVYVRSAAGDVTGFIPLVHLLPHVALKVIQREVAFHEKSHRGRIPHSNTATMGTPFRLQALDRLQQQTLTGLRVFLVAGDATKKGEDVLLSQILDVSEPSTLEQDSAEDDLLNADEDEDSGASSSLVEFMQGPWGAHWGSGDLRGRLGNMAAGPELSRHLSGLHAVEWSALGRRSQVHSFSAEPQVYILDRAFPDSWNRTDPVRHLREQPLGAARSKFNVGFMTHGLVLHHGVDVQELWVVTTMSLEAIIQEASGHVSRMSVLVPS